MKELAQLLIILHHRKINELDIALGLYSMAIASVWWRPSWERSACPSVRTISVILWPSPTCCAGWAPTGCGS